ncbi:MAG: hypothetical protein NE327_07500 [Lentisphaeraceae bacterium]|nr:hypothetical protein [Lentisphaeraceae bacterium]
MHQAATVIGTAALAVKEFTINPEGDSNGLYVRIVGRKSGLLDWFLSLIKIDSTTVFEVYKDHIKFTQANLSGRMTSVIPLSAMSSTSSGYFKPILYLVIGIPLLTVVIGLIFIIFYFLQKSLMVTAVSHGGTTAAIAFKRSVIEGIRVEAEQAEEVVEIINKLVLEQQAK